MHILIGADVGTTLVKACAVDAGGGGILAATSATIRLDRQPGGIAEQDPEGWYRALCKVVGHCVSRLPADARISSLAISAQGGSVAALGHKGSPLAPAMTWLDTRCTELAEQLRDAPPYNTIYRRTGWPLTGTTALYPRWLRLHMPAVLERARLFLTTPDYLSHRLTGRAAIDPTAAAMTQVFHLVNRRWDTDLLTASGIVPEQLPEILPSGTVIGAIRPDAARDLCLPDNVPLVCGGHDQYCGALGMGAVHPGDAVLSSGTTWVLLAMAREPWFDPRQCFKPGNHVMEGGWGSLASMVTGGICLEWARDVTGARDYGQIDREVASRPPGARGVRFYPYLSGSHVPDQCLQNRGMLAGLSLEHDRTDLLQAVMEGVTLEFRRLCGIMEEAGRPLESIRLSGGAAKSEPWRRMIADILDKPVDLPATADTACMGAAVLAGIGAGLYCSAEEGIAALGLSKADRVEPDPRRSAQYRQLYRRYLEGYPHLCDLYAHKGGMPPCPC